MTYSIHHVSKNWFFYGLVSDDIDRIDDSFINSYIVFVLGSHQDTLTIPTQLIKQHLLEEKQQIANDGKYKLNIQKKDDKYVFIQLPQLDTTPYFRNFAGLQGLAWEDAITPNPEDLNEPTNSNRIKQETYRILRDTKIARYVKRLYDYKCQLCNYTIELPNGKKYAESHHIIPLGAPHNGPDVCENVLCVCPNHHAELDYGVIQLLPSAIFRNEKHKISEEYIKYHNTVIYKKPLEN